MKSFIKVFCFAMLTLAASHFLALSNLAQTSNNAGQSIQTTQQRLTLGSSSIVVNLYEKSGLPITFLSIHHNEQTGIEAVKEIIQQHGGRLIEVVSYEDSTTHMSCQPPSGSNNSGRCQASRYISFQNQGKNYRIDPNRIFGNVATIQKSACSNSLTPCSITVARNVQAFANQLLQLAFPNEQLRSPDKFIVAVHNNTNNNYSIINLQSDIAPSTRRVVTSSHAPYQAVDQDTDDFFYVTVPKFYDSLKNQDFNVVLQDNDRVQEIPDSDDGSLSVYCGKKNIPYINVEAEHSHLQEQIEMLNAVLNLSS